MEETLAITDDDGRWIVNSLNDAAYDVWFRDGVHQMVKLDGAPSEVSGLAGAPGPGFDAPAAADIVMTMPDGGSTVSGRITTAPNVGAPGAKVSLVDSAGRTIDSSTAKPDGTYSFANVPPSADVKVRADDGVRAEQPVSWPTGQANIGIDPGMGSPYGDLQIPIDQINTEPDIDVWKRPVELPSDDGRLETRLGNLDPNWCPAQQEARRGSLPPHLRN